MSVDPSQANILLVDDQEDNLVLASAILHKLNENVVCARSGAEALRLLSEQEFAVVVMDIMLPEMDGFETVRQVRKLPLNSATPIIFITAMAPNAEAVAEAYDLGAADFLYKPVIPEVILAKVAVFVDLSRRKWEVAQQAQRIHEMERDRHRRELRQETDLFKRLVESVREYAIFLLNPEGTVVSWNSGSERILGYSAHEIIGQAWSCFFPAPHTGGREATKMLEKAKEQEIATAEMELVRKCGSSFWASVTLTPLRDENGQLLGFSQIVRDNTDRKEAEDNLNRRADELSRSNSELQRFAYVASHDLKEPLRMVSSYVQLLQMRYRDQLDSEAQEFIGFATSGVKRMYALINELLEYSRIGREPKASLPIDCNDLLNEVVENLKVAIEESHTEIENTGLPGVYGTRSELAQLFQNLLGNAIKFRSDRSPKVKITARATGGTWLFSVADNGIGIDPQYSGKVFEIFQRLHTRDKYPGSGVGLAICKKIVEHHHGRIWFESIPGESTVFHFTLPRPPREATA